MGGFGPLPLDATTLDKYFAGRKGGLMYQDWLLMEEFYYLHFAIVIVIGLVFGIFLLAAIFHIKESLFAKRYVIVSVCIFLGLALYIWYGFNQYGHLIDRTSHVTAALRDYKPTFFYYQFPYSTVEKNVYRSGYLPDSFKKSGLYDEEKLIQEVEFLGKSDQNIYYFEINGAVYSAGKKWVKTSDSLKVSQRQGIKFNLKDSRFTQLGFVESSKPMLQRYLIPQAIGDKHVTSEDEERVSQIQTSIYAGWISK